LYDSRQSCPPEGVRYEGNGGYETELPA